MVLALNTLGSEQNGTVLQMKISYALKERNGILIQFPLKFILHGPIADMTKMLGLYPTKGG